MQESASRRAREGEWSIISYYVTVLRRLLRPRGRLAAFALALLMHAAGHAAMALAAAGLALALSAAGTAQGALFPRGEGPRGDGGSAGLALRVLSRGVGATRPWPGPESALGWSLLGLGIVVVKVTAGIYATYVQGRLSADVGASLRLDLLDRVFSVHRLRRPRHGDQGTEHRDEREARAQSGGSFESGYASGASGESGELGVARSVAALTERVHEVELGLKEGLLGGLRCLVQLVPLAAVLFALSPRTAAAAILVLGTFGALLARARTSYRGAAIRIGAERSRLLAAADESVRHAELWVSYGAERAARRRLSDLGEAIARAMARLDARAATLSGANEVLGAGALALSLALARTGWLGRGLDRGTLLGFAIAFFLAYRPLRELADARLSLARAAAAYAQIVRVAPVAPTAARSGASDAGESARIEPGRRVWRPGVLQLDGLLLVRGRCGRISMRIEPGSIVALTGPTGVGKTTLLRTLLGLERAAGGHLFFDGTSLDDCPAGPEHRPFVWLPQDAPLLADTLDANVGLGAPAAAASAVLAPLGADHLAGALGAERLGDGRSVSGGERQWIALARAMATGQPVLLLDEPTSSLDTEAQRRVLEGIARLRGARTVLLVTHRPEPLAIADRVLRMGAAGAFEVAA